MNYEKYIELNGFDIELTGLDCRDEIDMEDWFEHGWKCPFIPGCGAKNIDQCAAVKQFAMICRAPKQKQ